MKNIGIALVVVLLSAFFIYAMWNISITSCPNGNNDKTRWGCGYSMEEINKMNCEKLGGVYFYGGTFDAGSCLVKSESVKE